MGLHFDFHGPSGNYRRLCRHIIQLVLLASIIGATRLTPAIATTYPTPKTAAAISNCNEKQDREIGRRLLYISTLDGKLSAMDLLKSGKLYWSISTGPGPLISSSIHQLELTNNGQFVRMIPSLSGGIYKFNGESIDPIPISAENLLSSSTKFSEDLVISGGKETRTYGISVRTGQILYECSINGCTNVTASGNTIKNTVENFDENNLGENSGYITPHDPLLDDVIIVRRQTQTVRAVESRTGMERWNFSVGQHEVDLVNTLECQQDRNKLGLDLFAELNFNVVVPEGIICVFSKTDPHKMLWKYKFDHPIVSAWYMNLEDKLIPIDIFSSAPWVWDKYKKHVFDKPLPRSSASIYLGMYKKQLYIQDSIQLRPDIIEQTGHYFHLTGEAGTMPIIPWRPISARSNSFLYRNKITDKNFDRAEMFTNNDNEHLSNNNVAVVSQSVQNASEFGFYFYTYMQWDNQLSLECSSNESTSSISDQMVKITTSKPSTKNNELDKSMDNRTINEDLGFSLDDIDAPVKVVILSFWFWWKEIVVIAVTSAVILNMFLGQRAGRRIEREYLVIERHVPVQTAIEATEASTQALLGLVKKRKSYEHSKNIKRSVSMITSYSDDQFRSRFQTDFELIQCLGRGGFGVVFEAKNKLDENTYAIKRITLPNRESSRQRVLREARTLASCEHQNIVRYFHCWVETPPIGWQEEEDRKMIAHELSTFTQTDTNDGSTFSSLMENLTNNQSYKDHKFGWNKKITYSVLNPVKRKDNDNNNTSLINIREQEEFENGEEDSCVIFRESESKEKNNADIDGYTFDRNIENLLEGYSNPNSKSLDIHSASLDLKKKDHQLSNSFLIESVLSKSGAYDFSKNSTNNSIQFTKRTTISQTEGIDKPNKIYLYIQMQLCRKESLRDWLRDNRTEVRTVHIADIFYQIVDAVEYVHLKGLIHRDLKPSNIFFSQDGRIKIGDFGLVTDVSDIPSIETKCGDHICDRYTQQVGTHLYMSPEQLNGKLYDYKVDIYSLGLIFFELHVYFSTEMERIITLRDVRKGKFPIGFYIDYPAEYALLQQMLSLDPTERPQTKQIKHQLHAILPDLINCMHSQHAFFDAQRISRNRTLSSGSDTELQL